MGTYELVKGGLSMDKCEEKTIAKKFFETEMGKLFLNKVLASRNLEKQIIKLNQKVHELEYQNEITPAMLKPHRESNFSPFPILENQ